MDSLLSKLAIRKINLKARTNWQLRSSNTAWRRKYLAKIHKNVLLLEKSLLTKFTRPTTWRKKLFVFFIKSDVCLMRFYLMTNFPKWVVLNLTSILVALAKKMLITIACIKNTQIVTYLAFQNNNFHF